MQRYSFLAASVLCAVCVAAQPDVRIDAFQSAVNAPELVWIGKAIEQSLASDFPPGDSPPCLVSGNYQVIDSRLRVTGKVVDPTGKQIGALKADGDTHELFAVEDQLSRQIRAAVTNARRSAQPINAPSALSLTTPYSGPVRFDPRVLAAERAQRQIVDHNAAPAQWRYYYSSPFGYGCFYGSCYNDYLGGYGCRFPSGVPWRGEY